MAIKQGKKRMDDKKRSLSCFSEVARKELYNRMMNSQSND